jgi:hypothetical protein
MGYVNALAAIALLPLALAACESNPLPMNVAPIAPAAVLVKNYAAVQIAGGDMVAPAPITATDGSAM